MVCGCAIRNTWPAEISGYVDLWYYIIYSHNYTETTVVTIVSITGSSQRYHILSRMQPYSCQDVDDPEFYTPSWYLLVNSPAYLVPGQSTNSSDGLIKMMLRSLRTTFGTTTQIF